MGLLTVVLLAETRQVPGQNSIGQEVHRVLWRERCGDVWNQPVLVRGLLLPS